MQFFRVCFLTDFVPGVLFAFRASEILFRLSDSFVADSTGIPEIAEVPAFTFHQPLFGSLFNSFKCPDGQDEFKEFVF